MANAPVKYLNKVMLKGRLGKEPELRFMPSGDPVCNFSMATRSGRHVEWHKVVAYENLADYVKAAFTTGDFVYVEAEIKTREFLTAEDKANGRKARKVTELIAHEAHLLAKRGEPGEDEELTPGAGEGDGPLPGAQSTEYQNENSGLPKFV